jgi:hypothetical protein
VNLDQPVAFTVAIAVTVLVTAVMLMMVGALTSRVNIAMAGTYLLAALAFATISFISVVILIAAWSAAFNA